MVSEPVKVQSISELEDFYGIADPWGFEHNPEDKKRKEILLSEIPDRKYERVLDIGCGNGFITRDLPGREIIGADISSTAVGHARKYESPRLRFVCASIFDLPKCTEGTFDLVLITGVLYPQYIGRSYNFIYPIVESLLRENGILVSVHIDDWYSGRFPFLLLNELHYPYREYIHRLEVYVR